MQGRRRLVAIFFLAFTSMLSVSARVDSQPARENNGAHALGKRTFAFALIGDAQYNAQEDAKFVNLRDEINQQKLAFVLHVGDFKSGSSPCTDALYLQRFALFQTFTHPFIYVFGDNEWTDCHRRDAGAFDPLERLDKLRQIFTPGDQSLGKHPITLDRQSQNLLFRQYRENVRWEHEAVLFVGLNIPGSNNNFPPYATTLSPPQQAANLIESRERNQANLLWMREAFALVRTNSLRGLLFFMQGNPFVFPPADHSLTGYGDFLAVLESETRACGRPVVLVHGDTHSFRIDQPAPQPNAGDPRGFRIFRLPNFTRVEVFGSPEVHWVRGVVDAEDPALFTFIPEFVDMNR